MDWGPGHHAFFENPVTKQGYIVYHRWNNVVNGKKPPYRTACSDLPEFDKDGNIPPVKMTDELRQTESANANDVPMTGG